jgi:hypothetical protein
VARSRSTSTELGPLSATGSIADGAGTRGSFGVRSVWVALILAAAFAVGAFWLRARSTSSGRPLAAPVSLAPPVPNEPRGDVSTRPSAATDTSARAADPRAPSAAELPSKPIPDPNAATAPAGVELPAPHVAPAKSVELHTEKQALRPAPTLVPVATPSARSDGDNERQAKHPPTAKDPLPAPVRLRTAPEGASVPEFIPNPEPPNRKDREKGREKDSSRDDPWNPNSFGDRH